MSDKSLLYTRTGDNGTTSLVGGERVPKDSVRLESYGTIDELSSFIGAVLSDHSCPNNVRTILLKVQNKLFNIGCYLATASTIDSPSALFGLTRQDIAEIENNIDALDAATPKIRAFVLPGGTMLAAHAHIARTVCRRAERRILTLQAEAPVDNLVLEYINRLSDMLFIMARYINHQAGVAEITWDKNA